MENEDDENIEKIKAASYNENLEKYNNNDIDIEINKKQHNVDDRNNKLINENKKEKGIINKDIDNREILNDFTLFVIKSFN